MGREGDDEFELSLELSIGGSYAKSANPINNNHGVSRSDFSCGKIDVGAENGFEFVDRQKRCEIDALRREEKLKKLKVLNGEGDVNLMEDKLILEARRFQGRVHDRERREKDGIFSEDLVRKREKNGRNEVVEDLNISLFTENKISGALFTHGNGNANHSALSNVSDDRSASQKGDSSSDTRSQSSSEKVQHLASNISSSSSSSSSRGPNQCSNRVIPEQCMKVVSPSTPQLYSNTSQTTEKSKSDNHSDQTDNNNTCSTTENQSSPTSKEKTNGLIHKPPKPPNNNHNHNHNGASSQRMPCVTTTGNGANGKTVIGFLYKYTKTEVSIMCACHGSSFSPAQFVEHAGGVDIVHPLRHITIVPSSALER